MTPEQLKTIKEALERASARIGCPPGDNADADLYRELLAAIVILASIEGEGAGLTREEAKTMIRNMRERCRSGQCDAAKATPQPAKVLTDEEMEYRAGRWNAHYCMDEPFLKTLTRFGIYLRDNGYLAPVPPVELNLLTEDFVKARAMEIYPPDEMNDGHPWYGHRRAIEDSAARHMVRHLHKLGYLAPAPPVDKLIQAGDEMKQWLGLTLQMDGESCPDCRYDWGNGHNAVCYQIRHREAMDAWDAAKSAAPAPVDIERIMEAVKSNKEAVQGSLYVWTEREFDADLRTRLTNALNKKQ